VANQNYDWWKIRKEESQHTLMGRLSPEMATTPSPCFTPICFTASSFNNHYQYTPFLNSCPLILGLMFFSWFISTYLSFFFKEILLLIYDHVFRNTTVPGVFCVMGRKRK
jgi:hypothetical protein